MKMGGLRNVARFSYICEKSGMQLTSGTLSLTPILAEAAQTTFPFTRSCMAGFMRADIVIVTDVPIVNPFPEATISVKPGLYIPVGTTSGSVSNNGFECIISAGSPTTTTVDLAFSGNDRELNRSGKCVLIQGVTYWQLEIAIEFQLTADVGSFTTTGLLSQSLGRLLNSVNAATVNLNNTSGGVYQVTKRIAFDCYVTDTTGTTNVFVSEAMKLDWYSVVNYPIKINGVTQTNLFSRQGNAIEIEYAYPHPTFTVSPPVVMLVKAANVGNLATDTYGESIEISCKSITATPSAYPTTTYWTGFDQNNRIKTTGGTAWTPVVPPLYKFGFQVDETLLTPGETYYIICVFQFQDPNPPNDCYHYSVISGLLTVTDAQEPADPTGTDEIDIQHGIYNTGMLSVSPQQRVRNQVVLDGATYNAVRGVNEFIARASRVTVDVYSEETTATQVIRHFYDSQSITRLPNQTWNIAGGLSVTQDVGLQTLSLSYLHRLRYEPQPPNFRSEVISPAVSQLPAPASQMDMNGKNVIIRFTIECRNGQDVDTFIWYQVLIVDNYDTVTLTHEAQDILGNPITQLCSDVDVVCVESTGGGTAPAFSLIDKSPYTQGQIREYDGFSVGALPVLTDNPIISSDAAFVGNTHKMCVDATQLDLLTPYRVSIVTQKAVTYPCYVPANTSDPAFVSLVQRMTIAAGAAPNSLYQANIASVITKLKNAGVWQRLDCFYMMVSYNEFAARLNWIKNAHNLTPFNGAELDFQADGGYFFTTLNRYLDTNYIPSTQAVQYLGNDACYGMFGSGGNAGFTGGSSNGNGTQLPYWLTQATGDYADSTHLAYINSPPTPTPPLTFANITGVFTAAGAPCYRSTNRISDVYYSYANGIPYGDLQGVTAPLQIPTLTMLIGQMNISGLPFGRYGNNYRFCANWVGRSLNTSQQAVLYEAIKCFCQSINAPLFTGNDSFGGNPFFPV